MLAIAWHAGLQAPQSKVKPSAWRPSAYFTSTPTAPSPGDGGCGGMSAAGLACARAFRRRPTMDAGPVPAAAIRPAATTGGSAFAAAAAAGLAAAALAARARLTLAASSGVHHWTSDLSALGIWTFKITSVRHLVMMPLPAKLPAKRLQDSSSLSM
ncbi:MAG: hypothetical protein J3K34DRAFT_400462 [Monoraphidium minutum]|nr:MAG: hypothetical protein J3K34DRAFT_400462 [Monoraphidium minutum]